MVNYSSVRNNRMEQKIKLNKKTKFLKLWEEKIKKNLKLANEKKNKKTKKQAGQKKREKQLKK